MGHIFADTDDISFGGGIQEHRPNNPNNKTRELPTPPKSAPVSQQGSRSSHKKEVAVRPPQEIDDGLRRLVESMKASFFPHGPDEGIRCTILSPVSEADPFMIFRNTEESILFGTGFSRIVSAGKDYASFPDMRLPYSEKDRLVGWVLRTPGFDMEVFRKILEVLGFPHVYGTRDVIAYIRDNIKDQAFLDRCRFFEIFSSGVKERKIGDFLLESHESGIIFSYSGSSVFLPESGSRHVHAQYMTLSSDAKEYHFLGTQDVVFHPGEILDILKTKISKHTLKFTFDTFYLDKNSVGVLAGYTLGDREILAENGVLTFVLEEDVRARAIMGHIFIDSRGFVHAYEMMTVHKEILKGIRSTYEQTILSNPRIERSDLVQVLRRELTKYCYLLTGRTPVVMPIIIER